MSKPLVYIASPYTKGDPCINTRFQCAVFDRMMSDDVVFPVAPLWSHFQHTCFPRPYEDWIKYDLALIERCDALVRLTADLPQLGYEVSESSGADNEVEFAHSIGLPVFFSIAECYSWVSRSEHE